MLKKLLIPFLFLGCLGTFAQTQTITVCPQCPIRTIAQGLAQAKENDTVIVEKGVYGESNLLIDKPLTLIGKDRPVIKGQYPQDPCRQGDGQGISLCQCCLQSH